MGPDSLAQSLVIGDGHFSTLLAIASAGAARAKRVANTQSADRERGRSPGEAGRQHPVSRSRARGSLDFDSTAGHGTATAIARSSCGIGRVHDGIGRLRALGSFAPPVASRAVQAFGAAMLMPSSLALLMAAVPAARRAVAVSTWSAAGAMAAALGPPIGGVLVEFSWRWIFFLNLPVALAALAASPWILANTRATGTGIPDLFGALSLVVGVAALVWALIECRWRAGGRRASWWPPSAPDARWRWRYGVRCVIRRRRWISTRCGSCRCGRVASRCCCSRRLSARWCWAA